ncbi:hypothetical protein KKD70_01160 [Patescibacteria group bacterium]|nr:hypothetical protein [Patescibacteria group bacterium]
MELSVYLGKLISVVLVVIGLALLIRSAYYTKVYKTWMKNEGLMLFTTMVLLVAGVALVLAHNVWTASWEVIITIVGWGMVLKGAIFAFLPKELNKLIERFLNMSWLLPIGGVIWVIGGLYLGYNVWFI